MTESHQDCPGPPPSVLTAGVVAHNEEQTLARALRSLLGQRLPAGFVWGSVWIVASGCTDGTVAVATEMAREDARIHVVVEPTRHGKAEALNQVLRRAEGAHLILLNADATAEPGAVAALLAVADGREPPFAVMGCPTVPSDRQDLLSRMLRLLWTVHHQFHLVTLESGGGNHLSDELLLLSLPSIPQLPAGLINDGSFLGAWLDLNHGRPLYAPTARVGIELPSSLRDHLTQRRRIQVGHAQVAQLLHTHVSTLPNFAMAHPAEGARILQRAFREDPPGLLAPMLLLGAEAGAALLSVWDRLPPRRDHAVWERVRRGSEWIPAT
jgi:cellulose synthase/poly-beta-1,6-N-acetylglucosamine synthase-like glycosyltransferase